MKVIRRLRRFHGFKSLDLETIGCFKLGLLNLRNLWNLRMGLDANLNSAAVPFLLAP